MYDNTLLVLTTDNGGGSGAYPGSSYPLRGGKQTVFEGGVRVAPPPSTKELKPAVRHPVRRPTCAPLLHLIWQVRGTAILHGGFLPPLMRGIEWGGLSHLVDWLPTLLGRATDGAWASNGLLNGYEMDGVDIWEAILTDSHPR